MFNQSIYNIAAPNKDTKDELNIFRWRGHILGMRFGLLQYGNVSGTKVIDKPRDGGGGMDELRGIEFNDT